MPLSRYASECWRIAEELEQYLRFEDIDEVEELIGGIQFLDWLRWRRSNDALLEKIVGSPPGARERILKKLDRRQFLLSILGARQRCLEAAEFLKRVADEVWVGGSYRSTAARAGTLLREMAEFDAPLFPTSWGTEARFQDG